MRKISAKNLKIGAIILFFLIFISLCLIYSEEIKHFGMIIVEKFGLWGLFGLTVFLDLLAQPISPLYFVFGYTFSESPFFTTAMVGGIASVLAGFIDYGLGSLLFKKTRIHWYNGSNQYTKAYRLFKKYGFWAVFIGINLSFPFAVLCWSAGIFRMPFSYFSASVILARIPRFILIAYLGTLVV